MESKKLSLIDTKLESYALLRYDLRFDCILLILTETILCLGSYFLVYRIYLTHKSILKFFAECQDLSSLYPGVGFHRF